MDAVSQSSSGAGFGRYLLIALGAAISGTLLKLLQRLGDTNLLVTATLYLLITLLPAALTYFLLARDQEKKLNQVVSTLALTMERLKELKRVFEVEKNYFANERLLNVERRVIEETGSSMQEVAELVSAFGDNDVAHVKLKERFRLHAKSILTFDRAFQFEVEQNFKSIGQVEHEFSQMPHDQRDELIYASGKDRTERLTQRYDLGSKIESIRQLTVRSSEIQRLASDTHQEIIKTLSSSEAMETTNER